MSYLTIDDHDRRPPYEQLASQLLRMISTGTLEAGDRLAPIRQLAGDLGVAPNTVARAYRELEQLGVIVSRGRRGTIVAEGRTGAAAARQRGATSDLTAAVDDAIASGLAPIDILRTVESRLSGLRAAP